MIFQTQTPALRPMTTAHLAQTMTLLELNGAELRQKIEAELAANPALEQVDEPRCAVCGRSLSVPGVCPFCNRPANLGPEQPIIFVSPYTDFQYQEKSDEDDDFQSEEWNTVPEDLPTFVLRQVALELAPEDRPLAAHILTSLDEDGLLRVSLLEIARYHHVPLSRVEKVISILQRAEPIGVCSATPQEALLVQLEILEDTRQIHPLARRAIQEGIDLLSRRAYNELGRMLRITPGEVHNLATFISENLNPYPARAHWGDIHHGAEARHLYMTPEIIISRLDNSTESPLVVEILSPFAGTLRVNPLFRDVLNQAPVDRADEWQSHLEQASLLVKCIQQRNHTMIRLMQNLVKIQRNFILEGDAYLVPITRAHLALELDVHESTVSRAVSGKAVQLPNRRIILLDKFFDRSLQVRTALRDLISQETRPLSDTEIAKKLVQMGYPVARRTVAKYRSMEGILPARFRHSENAQLYHE
jgi:RNA polymerase sigma-54 factor